MSFRTEGITERVARSAAVHPQRSFALWGVVVLAALALTATTLHGLTSNGTVTGHPASAQAKQLVSEAFPGPKVSDVVVVRSARYTVGDPAYRAYVSTLTAKVRTHHRVLYVNSYLTGRVPISADRHATIVQLAINGDGHAKDIEKIVKAVDTGSFCDHRRPLRQRRLQHALAT